MTTGTILACLLVGTSLSVSVYDMLSEMSERRMDADVPEETSVGAEPFSVRYSNELARAGVSEDAFLTAYRNYCTNLVSTATESAFDLATLRIFGALSILEQYDAAHMPGLLSEMMLNCSSRKLMDDLSCTYARISRFSQETMRFYRSREYGLLSTAGKEAAYRGLFSAQAIQGCSEDATNRIVTLAQEAFDTQTIRWELYDSTMYRLWPDYATSSNRYVAAQRALQADPPCASSNYLARVIAELEALPPGTMQMLSTNHLGQAWGE